MTVQATTGQALRLQQQIAKSGEPETEDEARGRSIIDPAVNSGLMGHSFTGHMPGATSINASIEEVRRITDAVKGGDLSDLEGMLIGQAVALQTMATNFAARAQIQTGQRNLEAFFGMALKAQSQSRATIQALVELKFPRQVVYSKNANINNGQQQINNGTPLPAQAQAEAGETTQSKILENSDGEWMDTRAPGTAVPAYPHLAAMGESHRAKNPRRKGQGVA